MCAAANINDFKRVFGAIPLMVVEVLSFIYKMKLGDWELNKAYEHFKYIGSGVCMQLVKKLMTEKSPAIEALKSLIEFYRNHSENDLLLGDLENHANWGLTVRDGKETLVVIDAGFSDDVYKNFYHHSKSNGAHYES